MMELVKTVENERKEAKPMNELRRKYTELDVIMARTEALGWMYAYACNLLDKKDKNFKHTPDLRDMEVPEILAKFHKRNDDQEQADE